MGKKKDIDEKLVALFKDKNTKNRLLETNIARKSSRPLSPDDWVQAMVRTEKFRAIVSKMFGNDQIIEEHGGIENFLPWFGAVMIKNREELTSQLGTREIGYPVSVVSVEKARLTIDINLTGKMSDILEDVKKAVERFREKQNVSQTRARGTKDYDPWGIYDLRHSGLSLLEIARKLTGKKYTRGQEKSPAYNPKLWPPYKRVERAYKQAVKMIQAAEN